MDRATSAPTASSIPKITDYDKLQQILDKVRDLKQSLANFFIEYEHGQPSWPTVLDQMNLLSSQITTLRTSMRHIYPLLRSNAIIPMCLYPDVDPNVEQITERRLSMFNHHTMPEMLRTKNLPEIEERERQLVSTPLNVTLNGRQVIANEIQMRVQELNALLKDITIRFNDAKETTERSEKHFDHQRFTNPTETKRLIEAMNYGIGLKVNETAAAAATVNDQTTINPALANQAARQNAPNVRIKTVARQNR